MSSVHFAVIAGALFTFPVYALAQLPTASVPPNVTTHESSAPLSADPSIGKWVGEWQIGGRYGSWSMEMEVDVNGDQVSGQVRSTGSPGCSLEWAKLVGVRKGEKIFAQYNLGGRCGKVELIYSIEPEGRVMTGTWSSEYPGYGTFRLTK